MGATRSVGLFDYLVTRDTNHRWIARINIAEDAVVTPTQSLRHFKFDPMPSDPGSTRTHTRQRCRHVHGRECEYKVLPKMCSATRHGVDTISMAWIATAKIAPHENRVPASDAFCHHSGHCSVLFAPRAGPWPVQATSRRPTSRAPTAIDGYPDYTRGGRHANARQLVEQTTTTCRRPVQT